MRYIFRFSDGVLCHWCILDGKDMSKQQIEDSHKEHEGTIEEYKEDEIKNQKQRIDPIWKF